MAPKDIVSCMNTMVTLEEKPPVKLDTSNIIGDQEKNTIFKNLALLCISFWCCFTAFHGIGSLQTSLNNEGNIGNRSLSLLFLSPTISNLLLSTLFISKLGPKWCMVLGLLLHSTFPIANLYPTWYTMYLSATITGLSSGLLWSAHGTYITYLGKRYASLSGESPEITIPKFFGAFFVCHRLSNVAGSLLSSIVLQRPEGAKHLHVEVIQQICGAAYCHEDLHSYEYVNVSSRVQEYQLMNSSDASHPSEPDDTVSSLYRPSTFQLYLLYSIYIFCALMAPILLSFLNSTKEEEKASDMGKVKVWTKLAATARLLFNPKILLLIPLIFFCGTWVAFVMGDYCVSFIACILGIDNIGYVMATFGAMAAITSATCGLAIKYTGRRSIFLLGTICSLATIISMLQWIANPQAPIVLHIFAGLWGVCLTIWTTQIMGFIGYIFKDQSTNEAFASYYTLYNASIGTWLTLGKTMCISTQLTAMSAILVVGVLGYICVEILVQKEEKKKTEEKEITVYSINPDNSGIMVTCHQGKS